LQGKTIAFTILSARHWNCRCWLSTSYGWSEKRRFCVLLPVFLKIMPKNRSLENQSVSKNGKKVTDW